MDEIAAFCKKWQIREFALFGSVLREDFRPDSDIDVMVTFDDDARFGIPALVRLQNELSLLMGRKVDVDERAALDEDPNQSRSRRIVESSQLVYAA